MQNQEGNHFEQQHQKGPDGEANDLAPKLTAHPSLDLNALEKQALEYQKLKQNDEFSQNLRSHLTDLHPRNEGSVASSLPDFFDASQVLRKMSGQFQNQEGSIVGPVMQNSQGNERMARSGLQIKQSPRLNPGEVKPEDERFPEAPSPHISALSRNSPLPHSKYSRPPLQHHMQPKHYPNRFQQLQEYGFQDESEFLNPNATPSADPENSELKRRRVQQKFIRDFEREAQKSNPYDQGGFYHQYMYQHELSANPSSSRYTSNHNVEFETISSHSNTQSKLLGKRQQSYQQQQQQ